MLKTIAISGAVFFNALSASNPGCCGCSSDPTIWTYAGYNFGDYIGVTENYAEIGAFMVSGAETNEAVFIDGRGYRFDNERWGASAGVGFRRLNACQDRAWGINAYYDYLEGRVNSFHDLSLGIESLGCAWDFRMNGYYHVGPNRRNTKETIFDEFTGNFIASCKRVEFSYDHIDAEVGHTFCMRPFGATLYAAIGPYYYHSRLNDFFGGFARIELNYNDIISFQVRASYDDTFHTNVQGRVLVSIPFDTCLCWIQACRNLLSQPVRREGVMFTDNCCDWTWNW